MTGIQREVDQRVWCEVDGQTRVLVKGTARDQIWGRLWDVVDRQVAPASRRVRDQTFDDLEPGAL